MSNTPEGNLLFERLAKVLTNFARSSVDITTERKIQNALESGAYPGKRAVRARGNPFTKRPDRFSC